MARLTGCDEEVEADESQRDRQSAGDPVCLYAGRKPRPEWSPEKHSDGENDRASNAAMKRPRHEVNQGPCQGHDREDKLRCRRRDMNWEIQEMGEDGYVDDPSADPQETGEVPDEETDHDPLCWAVRKGVDGPVGFGQGP